MSAVTTLPRIHGQRYRAVKESVRRACLRTKRWRAPLCESAIQQCEQRAAKVLREGGTASKAITAGLDLAKRLAGWRSAPTLDGAA